MVAVRKAPTGTRPGCQLSKFTPSPVTLEMSESSMAVKVDATVAKAPPTTNATAISTRLPRMMKSLKPLSMSLLRASPAGPVAEHASGQHDGQERRHRRLRDRTDSTVRDPHDHQRAGGQARRLRCDPGNGQHRETAADDLCPGLPAGIRRQQVYPITDSKQSHRACIPDPHRNPDESWISVEQRGSDESDVGHRLPSTQGRGRGPTECEPLTDDACRHAARVERRERHIRGPKHYARGHVVGRGEHHCSWRRRRRVHPKGRGYSNRGADGSKRSSPSENCTAAAPPEK